MNFLLLLFLSVFVVSVIGVGIVQQWAVKYGWVVHPRTDRWHTRATALYGGVGFYPAFLLGSIITYFPYDWLALISQRPETATGLMESVALLIGALLMFIFGWLDDLKQFSPVSKLLVQLIATSLFVMTGAVIPVTEVNIFNILLTYFWFIGIINAVNMLDNMDGLSSGIVFIAAGTVVALSIFQTTSPLLAIPIALSLMAALLGFWIYNRPPARIFMGDSGSLFIGYVIAALAIPSELNGYFGVINTETTTILALLIPATILAVPIFDTTLVTITRKWRAQKASQGGQDHSSHRLVSLGIKENQVIWIFYSIAVVAGIIAVGMQYYTNYALLLFSGFAIGLLLVGIYLAHMTAQIAKNEVVPPTWTQIVSYFLYKWYAGMIMLDLVLIVACYYGAYLLRFDGVLLSPIYESILNTVPVVVPACLLAFVVSGIYSIQWHFISVPDIARYVLGVVGGVILSLAVVVIVNRFEPGQSRGAYLIFGMLLILVLVATRLSFRFFDHLLSISLKNTKNEQYQSILIYGAGKGGKILLEEIFSNPEFKTFRVIGFIDDDDRKIKHKLHGLPIRSLTEWSDYIKEMTPEIWISSKLISINKIRKFENQLKTNLSIRCLNLKISNLQE